MRAVPVNGCCGGADRLVAALTVAADNLTGRESRLQDTCAAEQGQGNRSVRRSTHGHIPAHTRATTDFGLCPVPDGQDKRTHAATDAMHTCNPAGKLGFAGFGQLQEVADCYRGTRGDGGGEEEEQGECCTNRTGNDSRRK